MIQSIKPDELDKFNDLLTDHLNELTTELKLCTDSKINKLLRAEVSNITSMINGLSKHKLFASNYEELTKADSSEDDESAPPKRAPKQKKVAFEEKSKVVPNKERDIVAKPPRKCQQKSIRGILLKVK
jgi:23S rRNA-/tRNA-specific pseudouridylate synthase